MDIVKIASENDMTAFFSEPFIPKKCLFQKNSDFFKEGNEFCKFNCKQLVTSIDDEMLLHKEIPEFTCNEKGCALKFKTVYAHELHYRSFHINYCSECKKSFSTDQLLQHHIEEAHDSFLKAASEKYENVYGCLIKDCRESFQTLDQRSEHLFKIHSMKVHSKPNSSKVHPNEMDVSEPVTFAQEKKYVSRVPQAVCFGKRSARSFNQKKSRIKSKPKKPSDISDINMKELTDALE